MTAESLLRTLVEIRQARQAKFIPYDLDRRLKRKEKDTWEQAEAYFKPKADTVVEPKPLKPNKPKAA